MTKFYDLPAPTTSEKIRSEALTQQIKQQILQKGPISFAEFMQLALYHPDIGYYTAKKNIIGKTGDFITAPELSPLFAECLAAPCIETFQAIGEREILEFGAGNGTLAGSLLNALDTHGHAADKYLIVEPSARLRSTQLAYIKKHFPSYLSCVEWLSEPPTAFNGIIIANEVLDALPVHRFQASENNEFQELYVNYQDQTFCWKQIKSDQIDANAIRNKYQLQPGYQFEINFSLNSFIADIAHSLQKGIVLLLDYGYGQNEYYHPQRNQGTLTCFYQHHKHSNPLIHPGLQDISVHVDFTRVIEIASKSGFDLLGFTSQAGFLLDCGLMQKASLLEEKLSEEKKFELHQAIKTLTLPTEMGDIIKVMGLAKGCACEISGFTTLDRRRDL